MFYLDRPLNFAHQGASHEAPPNTLAAFLLAAELGADGIEFDVQLSKDGHAMVIHDFTVDATTDGHGRVRVKTLAELQALDAGKHLDPLFAGERIPTLAEVLDLVGGRLLLNIELKTPGRRDGGLAEVVVRHLVEEGLLDQVIVSSFNPLAIGRVKQIELYSGGLPLFLRRGWFRLLVNPNALHPHYKLVDRAYMHWARRLGCRVNVWTVDDPGEMWRLVRQGVDIIITNRPDLLGQVLRAGRAEGHPAQSLAALARAG